MKLLSKIGLLPSYIATYTLAIRTITFEKSSPTWYTLRYI